MVRCYFVTLPNFCFTSCFYKLFIKIIVRFQRFSLHFINLCIFFKMFSNEVKYLSEFSTFFLNVFFPLAITSTSSYNMFHYFIHFVFQWVSMFFRHICNVSAVFCSFVLWKFSKSSCQGWHDSIINLILGVCCIFWNIVSIYCYRCSKLS